MAQATIARVNTALKGQGIPLELVRGEAQYALETIEAVIRSRAA